MAELYEIPARLRAAGSAGVPVNAPASADRIDQLAAVLAEESPGMVVDLGCGRGHLAVRVAERSPSTYVLGVDLDDAAITAARARAASAGMDDRATFEVGDAAEWSGPCEQAICVASSHALGGPAAMLLRLASLVPRGGLALVGDGVWSRRPDRWHRDTFGELPDVHRLVEWAEEDGWAIEDLDRSTTEEWDAFEAAWTAGVEAVDDPEAQAFAQRRREEYQRYRGVLGFAWLILRRAD